jgi:hypothetical protein
LDALREALKAEPNLFRGTIDPDLNPLFAFPEYRRLLAPSPEPTKVH